MSRSVRVAVVAALIAAPVVGEPALAGHATTPTQTIKIGTNTHLSVQWRGSGLGVGLSQYGALGRADAKITYQHILGFYYPHTSLTTVSGGSRIRVLIGKAGTTTSVSAVSNLAVVVDGVTKALATTGIRRYRFIANSSGGLTLQKLPTAAGATWQTVRTVSDKSAFRRTDGSPVRLFLNDGTSVSYYGMLRAVRLSATRVETVNSIGYDQYVQGVVPNEMPATWPRAATDAQAVAARTYGDWQVHQPMNANYDICDNSNCQVYGGHTSYDKSGKVTSTDFPQAANDTAGQVLRYNSGPVFAQFSASDGGWTVANPTFPYLTAQADTYDKYVVPGSPATITVAALAKQLKLTKITEIDLVRDGNGGLAAWNGRVVSGTATDGTQTVSFTGEQFQQDVNNAVPNVPVDTTWIQLTPKP